MTRVSLQHQAALIQVIDKVAMAKGSQLFLFGSRVDPQKRGGDIDLLLLVPSADLDRIKEQAHKLKAQLRQAAGDQKVDLTIFSVSARSEDHPFLGSLKNRILLKEW